MNESQNNEEITKKEKAAEAGKDVAEVAARGLSRYYGGQAGGMVADTLLNTKTGQKFTGYVGNRLSKNPRFKKVLADNQELIHNVKPIANSVIDSMGTNSNIGNTNDINNVTKKNKSFINSGFSNNDFGDDKGENENKSSFSGLFNGKSVKLNKLIIAAVGVFVFLMLFIVVIIAPLMSLGIIDIEGISGPGSSGGSSGGGSSSGGYTQITSSVNHWWPIGSSETTTRDGIVYAAGEPYTTDISSYFGGDDGFRDSTHKGIDIGNAGTGVGVINIIASRDGTVIYPYDSSYTQFEDNGYYGNPDGQKFGNFVMIQHGDGTTTIYAHLSKNTITVFAGDTVKQGQVVGKMGHSGSSTAAHLHFEIRANGTTSVDPMNYVSNEYPRPTNKQSTCLKLKNLGLPDNSVAAIMTNMYYESSFIPTAIGDDGTSYGLCQWHESRYDELKAKYPSSYATIGSQVDFLMYELENKFFGLHSKLNAGTNSASDLTYDFCIDFERPANMNVTCRNRTNSTNSYVTYVKNACR